MVKSVSNENKKTAHETYASSFFISIISKKLIQYLKLRVWHQRFRDFDPLRSLVIFENRRNYTGQS